VDNWEGEILFDDLTIGHWGGSRIGTHMRAPRFSMKGGLLVSRSHMPGAAEEVALFDDPAAGAASLAMEPLYTKSR
jgi:hypothetical protein